MITEYEYFIVVILFVGSIVLSLRSKKNNTPSMRGVFSLDASHVMKAMCCIIIILHHWAFRVQSPWTQNLLTSLGGVFAIRFLHVVYIRYRKIRNEASVESYRLCKTSDMEDIKTILDCCTVNYYSLLAYRSKLSY